MPKDKQLLQNVVCVLPREARNFPHAFTVCAMTGATCGDAYIRYPGDEDCSAVVDERAIAWHASRWWPARKVRGKLVDLCVA